MTIKNPGEVEMVRVFREIDAAVEGFASRSGLRCPPGCGTCCLSPEVEATVPECLPLARELFDRGDGFDWIGRLESLKGSRCALYAPEPGEARRGRCTVYAYRPSLCRLFGFAGRSEKTGRHVLSVCKTHRQECAGQVAEAEALVERNPDALPLFSDFSGRVESMSPAGGGRLPINEAILRALEQVGLERELRAREMGVVCVVQADAPPCGTLCEIEAHEEPDEPDTPPRPDAPPQAA